VQGKDLAVDVLSLSQTAGPVVLCAEFKRLVNDQ
jgi:hypothetical protein